MDKERVKPEMLGIQWPPPHASPDLISPYLVIEACAAAGLDVANPQDPAIDTYSHDGPPRSAVGRAAWILDNFGFELQQICADYQLNQLLRQDARALVEHVTKLVVSVDQVDRSLQAIILAAEYQVERSKDRKARPYEADLTRILNHFRAEVLDHAKHPSLNVSVGKLKLLASHLYQELERLPPRRREDGGRDRLTEEFIALVGRLANLFERITGAAPRRITNASFSRREKHYKYAFSPFAEFVRTICVAMGESSEIWGVSEGGYSRIQTAMKRITPQ